MGARIVICEDDEKYAELIRRYIEREGHQAVVVRDGRAAVQSVRTLSPDLLILDLMVPGIDGLDVCRILRTEYGLPILMVTARSGEADLVRALDLGVDDYLVKPCSPRVLTARVRALLRRSNGTVTAPVTTQVAADALQVDDLIVDRERHNVSVGVDEIRCTAGEFALLEVMVGAPGRVFTRKQLLMLTRGQDRYITERSIDVQISGLRRKLRTAPARSPRIVTVFGVGYKLIGDPGGA